MNVTLCLVGEKVISDTPLLGYLKGILDMGIIGGEAHHATQQGPVGTVATVSLGGGTVEGEVHPF